MRALPLPRSVRSALGSDAVWRLLPTPAMLYLNHECVRDPAEVPNLPKSEWWQRERRALLAGSEERLRNLESKGPGLATVSAVVVAGVLVAIGSGWEGSAWPGRVILVAAAVYSTLSLVMPLYLVGPLRRDAVHLTELQAAADAGDPEESLAEAAAHAAMENDLRNLRLSNLLDAGRWELTYALALLLLWGWLVPVTSVFDA